VITTDAVPATSSKQSAWACDRECPPFRWRGLSGQPLGKLVVLTVFGQRWSIYDSYIYRKLASYSRKAYVGVEARVIELLAVHWDSGL
jgi:hypothetical protein